MKSILQICFLPAAFLMSCRQPVVTYIEPGACRTSLKTPEFSEAKGTLILTNKSEGYRAVSQFNPDFNYVDVGGMNVGEALSISSSGFQRWKITDGPGNCLEIIEGPIVGQAYVITAADQDFGPE